MASRQAKNNILQYAREHQYDAVFLIDSDLVLHPRTLEQLVSSQTRLYPTFLDQLATRDKGNAASMASG